MADLSEGWKDRPPVQWMVQSYLGIGGNKAEPQDDAEFDAAVASMQ